MAQADQAPSLQVRLQVSRQQVLVEGPDDAEVIVTMSHLDVGTDPTVAFMRGTLKVSGSTGKLFDVLSDGRVSSAISRLASQL